MKINWNEYKSNIFIFGECIESLDDSFNTNRLCFNGFFDNVEDVTILKSTSGNSYIIAIQKNPIIKKYVNEKKHFEVSFFIAKTIQELKLCDENTIQKHYIDRIFALEYNCYSYQMFKSIMSQLVYELCHEVKKNNRNVFDKDIIEIIKVGYECLDEIVFDNKYINVINKKKLMKDVEKFLLEQVERQVSLNDISNKYHISVSYLSRIFKEYFGTSFQEYSINLKLKKSKEFLEQGFKINKVAKSLGYSSSQYYIKQFKKFYGVTPKKYQVECYLI